MGGAVRGGLGAAGVLGAIGAGADRLPGFGASAPAAAQSLWFAGLEQTALGDASLETESDSLIVSNVDVFDGEEHVTTAYGTPGEVVRIPQVPPIDDCGKLPPWPLPCYINRYRERVRFDLPDGTSAVGDDLRILAGEGESAVESLSSFSLSGRGIDTLRVIGEQTGGEFL